MRRLVRLTFFRVVIPAALLIALTRAHPISAADQATFRAAERQANAIKFSTLEKPQTPYPAPTITEVAAANIVGAYRDDLISRGKAVELAGFLGLSELPALETYRYQEESPE